MSIEPHTPDDDLPEEDLVAYLDGELDADEAGEIEGKLARDNVTRTHAEKLRKTYDLLDYLPKPEPSPTFASRTLTKLDAVAVPPAGVSGTAKTTGLSPALSNSAAMPRHSGGWLTFLAWSVAALAAAAIGYFGHLLAKPHLEAKTTPPAMQQVRLLEELPLFLGVDDIAFLKALDESPDLFEAEPEPVPHAAETVSSAELMKLEEVFQKLPAARQAQLRQLDEDYHALDAPLRDKYHATLERYAVWLDRLGEKDRREILSAPAGKERLEAIRLVKNRLWRESLPESWQQRAKNAAGLEEREQIYAEYRRQEADRKHDWLVARQQWGNIDRGSKPFPFDNPELAKQVDDYVNTVLKPRLSLGEQSRLDELRRETASGGYLSWYLYGAGILYSTELHPNLPEPKTGKPLTRVDDLPANFLAKLRPSGPVKPKRDFKDMPQHGKWPDFAEEVAREASVRNVPLPVSFGPCRPGEFKPEVEEVLTALRTKMTSNEKNALDAIAGKWPQYPRLFMELSRKHDLVVPGVSLPGAPSQWNKVYPFKPPRRL